MLCDAVFRDVIAATRDMTGRDVMCYSIAEDSHCVTLTYIVLDKDPSLLLTAQGRERGREFSLEVEQIRGGEERMKITLYEIGSPDSTWMLGYFWTETWYYAVIHCTTLCCTALYYTVLYCAVLYCTILQCTVLHYTTSVLCCTTLYCTVLALALPQIEGEVEERR